MGSRWIFQTHRGYKGSPRIYRNVHPPDGHELTRTETPLSGKINNSQGAAWLSYNYIKPDTTVFYVQLVANRNFSDLYSYHGLLSLSNGEKSVLLNDESGRVGTTPRFSAYLEQHFANRQILVVDFSASLYTDILIRITLKDTKMFLTT